LNDRTVREKPTEFAESLHDADRALESSTASKSSRRDEVKTPLETGNDAEQAAAPGDVAKARENKPVRDEENAVDSSLDSAGPTESIAPSDTNQDTSVTDSAPRNDPVASSSPVMACGPMPVVHPVEAPVSDSLVPAAIPSESTNTADASRIAAPSPPAAAAPTVNPGPVAAPTDHTPTVAESSVVANPASGEAKTAAENGTPTDRSASHAASRPQPTAEVPITSQTPQSGATERAIAEAANAAPVASEIPAAEVQADQQPTRARGRIHQSQTDRPIPTAEHASTSTPAAARALQVEAGVRLENATSQGAGPQMQSAVVGSQSQQPAIASVQPNQPQSTANQFASSLGAQETDQASEAQFSHRIVRGLSTMVNQRGGVMNMRLDPPELGALRVQMTMNRGVVTAEFQASTAQAHAMLERNMNTLRSALEGQGLTVDRLAVHAPATGSTPFSRDDGGQSTNHNTSRQQHDAAGGESRGRRDDTARQSLPQYRDAGFSSVFDESTSNDLRDLLAAV